MSDVEEKQVNNTGLTNLAFLDKFVIVIAALLACCMILMMFKPSLGQALANLAKADLRPKPEAPKFQNSIPGEVLMDLSKPIVIPAAPPAPQKKSQK